MVFLELLLLVGRFPERNEMIVCALSVFAHLEDDPAETTLYPADRSPLISADPLTSIGKCSPIVQSSAENKKRCVTLSQRDLEVDIYLSGLLSEALGVKPGAVLGHKGGTSRSPESGERRVGTGIAGAGQRRGSIT
jgi:hypothetical protein